MKLNANELALIRTTENRTDLYISIYQPATVLACQVNNASATKGDRVIPYDGISTGSGSFVRPNMLMLVGSSAGNDDMGSIRCRGISGSNLYVAENSDIQWTNDLHLTVLDYVSPNPIFPRIIQDPSNAEDVIFYKDFDVAYSNQNSILGSFVVAGPHRAGFLDGGQYQTRFSASGTYNMKGDVLTYSWFFGADASPTGSTARDPGLVAWSTVGHRSVRLVVSNSSGGNDTSYRYVSIYDKPEEGNTLPPLKWELIGFSENRNEGGITAKVRVFQILSGLRKHSLVVFWTDDWFGTTHKSLGGNYADTPEIFFNGFIQDGSIHYNYKESYTEFEIVSITNVMKEIENFPISTESNSNPTTWYEILNMTPPRAIYHFLQQHSTFLQISDWRYLDTTIQVQYFDSARESMYGSLDTFCKTGMISSIVADRQGTVWIEKAPEGKTAARTAYQIPMYLQKHDWVGEPDVTERLRNSISYVELGGIAYTGPTGTSLAYIGCAPGLAPASVGSVESNQGLILSSQQELNQLAGNVFAYRNAKYPNATFVLPRNYRNLDIAPIENVPITIDQLDTVRGIQLTNEPFHIQSLEWRYVDGSLYISNIAFHQLTNGVIGDTIDIPVIPPSDIVIPPLPPFSIPPLPPIELPMVSGSSIGPSIVLVLDRSAGILVTTNFDDDYPIWFPYNSGMSSGTYTKIGSVHMTPGGQLYVLTLDNSNLTPPIAINETGGTELWYAPYFGSSFGLVMPFETVTAFLDGGTTGSPAIASLAVDQTNQNAVAMYLSREAAGLLDDTSKILYGSPDTGFAVRSSPAEMSKDGGGTTYSVGSLPFVFGDGKWVLPCLRDDIFERSYLAVFNGDLSNRTGWIRMGDYGFASTRPVLTKRAGESSRLYFSQFGSTAGTFRQSLSNGDDIQELSVPGDIAFTYIQAFGCDQSGQYLIKSKSGGPPYVVQRSSDYGITWATVTGTNGGFVTSQYPVVANGLESLTWIVAKKKVQLTLDFGDTWIDKSGNLPVLVSGTNILQVIVVQ